NETERASSSTSAAKQLIKRFNFHSTMILKSNLGDENIVTTTENNDNSTSTAQKKDVETINDDDDDENSAKRFKPDDDFEELRSEQKEEVETLKLINPERYLRAPPPTNNGRAQKNILNPTPIASVNNLKLQMADWTANTELNLNSQLALKVMTELSPGGALMHGTSSQTLSQIVPQAIQEEMQNIYTSLRELLRHFWSCFPPSTPQIEEKIRRVHETLERFRTTKVVPFKEKVLTDTLADFHFFNVNDSNVDWSLHSPPQRQSPSMNTAYPFYDSSMNTLTSTTSLPIIRCLPTSSPLTIYQRTSSSSKSIRLQYTSSQRHTLTEIFNRTPYPNSAQNDIIAKRIGVKREQIRIWFQNHRRLVSKGIKQSKKSEKMALNYLPSSSEQQKLDEILIEIENEKSC
ncbi:unnamed protein product, partial [Didymodactylos carnosus]